MPETGTHEVDLAIIGSGTGNSIPDERFADQEIATTDADRAARTPWNTYAMDGLPYGPIGSPGLEALRAMENPAEGQWKYFVTVNQETGETLFSETYDQQLENEKKFREWCQKNPGKC